MAQPGDPYAAEREARRREAVEQFSSDEGVNLYAQRAHKRAVADLLYLSLWREHGAQEAGRRVCAQFGHEAAGRQCVRCGAWTGGR